MLSVTHFRPLFLAALLVSSACYAQQPAKPPLATVNGQAITEDDLKIAMDDIGGTIPQGSDAQKRKYVLDYLVDLKILAQSAEKQKMGDNPEFARRMAYLRDRALMETVMGAEAKTAVDDAKIKAFYDEAIKGLPKEEEVRARHILVASEDEAKAAVAKLKAGADFAKLAEEISKDPGSGKQGGDLGFFPKDRMVKEFADAAFAMKPGEVSDPVKSQFGYHIIKLEERREKQPPAIADVKEELARYLTQKAQQEMILKLRSDAKVELADEFKPKPAPAPVTPGAPAAPGTPAPATPAPAAPKP